MLFAVYSQNSNKKHAVCFGYRYHHNKGEFLLRELEKAALQLRT